MAIAFLPHGVPRGPFRRLADLSLVGCEWRGSAGTPPARAGDLGPDDHLVVRVSSKAMLARVGGLRCRVSLWLREPPCVQGRLYAAMPWAARRFHRVLTHQASLARRCPNAVVVPHGGSWIRGPVDPSAPRASRIAMVASEKASTEGHRLRHRIASWARTAVPDLELLGRGYRAFDDKADGHLPYMHSVVIENGSYPGYFTEKLVDCLRCGSVPIYWGDPEIVRHFDMAGIVECRDERELKEAILGADAAGFESRHSARVANAAAAERFADPFALAERALAGA